LGNQVVGQSVIKVHTDKGVITLPGRGDSWDALENAEFVADSLADIQMVNNEVVICSSKE
jgi:osmotically-inducible protein OsmY